MINPRQIANLQELVEYLNHTITQKNDKTVSLEQAGTNIVAIFTGDYGESLYETNLRFRRIIDLASDIEISNGGVEWLEVDWQEITRLTQELSDEIKNKPSS